MNFETSSQNTHSVNQFEACVGVRVLSYLRLLMFQFSLDSHLTRQMYILPLQIRNGYLIHIKDTVWTENFISYYGERKVEFEDFRFWEIKVSIENGESPVPYSGILDPINFG